MRRYAWHRLRRILVVGGLSVIVGAATAVGAYAQSASTAARGEDHPKMQAALEDLQKAQTQLQSAAHDFDGHRYRAIELTKEAIDQVQKGLESDTK